MKLNPEDLDVLSFDTTAEAVSGAEPSRLEPVTIATINDPTAATRCFICPPITYDYRCI
ncbi:hypothetical protein [Longimicrobium sp.]|uniref:hypothetical protein n=1 Tax=Longimicrobium sp. TaxID=2029185 RepID=UPI003B3A2CE4